MKSFRFLFVCFLASCYTFTLSSQEPPKNISLDTSPLLNSFDSFHDNEGLETEHLASEHIHTKFDLHQIEHTGYSIGLTEPILSAESEPLTTVAGCVNVISGHFFQVEKDLIDHSVDPLSFIRFYDSGNQSESMLGFGFGSQFPLWASDLQKGARHSYAMISEREGVLIPYKASSEHHHLGRMMCSIDPRLMQKGYTNVSRAATHSANFVNWKAVHRSQGSKRESWSIDLGNGSQRIYGRCVKIKKDHLQRMQFPTNEGYLLTEEIKPNGNKLRYSYRTIHDKPRLIKVVTESLAGNPINTLEFHYSPGGCTVTNGLGDSIAYGQEEEPCLRINLGKESNRKSLREVRSSQKGISTFRMEKNETHRKLVKIEKPDDRFIEIQYKEAKKSDEKDKVAAILAPCGPQGEKIKTHRFHYHKNSTAVWDALGFLKVYSFDEDQRLVGITDWNQHELLRLERYQWSQKEGQTGWLRSKSIELGDRVYHLKTFRYDQRGNVIRTTLYGNLTGEKDETFSKHQVQETDSYVTLYTYGERNLLKSTSTPEGWMRRYDYLPNTNLCLRILHHDHEKIQEREFFGYDEDGFLEIAVQDDGSSEMESVFTDCTTRKIKKIQPVKTPGPSFGKPQKTTEYAYDFSTGQQLPLKTIEYFYNAKGLESGQKVYNSKQEFCYETAKDYDERGRLVKERNPLGYETCYKWDDNDNKIMERIRGTGKRIYYTYDLANRVTRKQEKHDDGETFTTTYTYNGLNQLIAEIDPYGHETTYEYDSLGNQTRRRQPKVADAQGNVSHPTRVRTYNLLNQMTSETNENGFTTHYTYNSYGSPTRIIYPDGAIEQRVYYPSGWLKQKKTPDGTSIHYQYDYQGRLVKERILSSDSLLLKEEDYQYKGQLLRTKKDAAGLLTTYLYDPFGRKIEEKIGTLKTIRYAYDDFNRVITIDREGSQEYFEYDACDQIIRKSWRDSEGKLFAQEEYAYNKEGKQIQKKVWQSSNQVANDRWHYHSDGTLAWKENSLGHRTTWTYHHRHLNGLNQQVQCRLITDSLGRPTREADDTLHRMVRRDLYEGDKQMSCTHFDYDARGNLTKQHALVMADGQLLREYWVTKSYNSRGLLESETEMPQEKTTRFAYDGMKRLILKEKPDGVRLNYCYDPLGRLETLNSSDGTIGYTYHYDLHDNIIQVEDRVHQITQKRVYNEWNQCLQEELYPGLVITYAYDGLDRVTAMTLPDGSIVKYTYDAFHLTKIQRFHASNELLYEINGFTYDLQGNILKHQSPAGQISHAYDLLGRKIAIETASWQSYLEEFDAVGNLLKMKQRDPTGTLESRFAYDRFDYVCEESGLEKNHFRYDSLGNCLHKNNNLQTVNALNQIEHNQESTFSYDPNGNLKKESKPAINYTYDALNRLIVLEKEGIRTKFLYDAFGRCLQIAHEGKTQQLIYQNDQEIGSLVDGKVEEFRLIHPEAKLDLTFAIELKGEPFFSIQDFRGNICGLQKQNGDLLQWMRYSAFGAKQMDGHLQGMFNPWRFANRREVEDLSLFTHRFYHPRFMRWITPDPLGFEESLNLYRFDRNNPFCYKDPDGRFAIFIPLIIGAFGSGGLALSAPTVGALAGAAIGTALGWGVYEAYSWLNVYNEIAIDDDQEKKDKLDEKTRDPKTKPPVRTEPKNLEEQLTLEEAKGGAGEEIDPEKLVIKDPKYPTQDWKKVQQVHICSDKRKINIHYWENRHTNKREGFKFKDLDGK